jgi:hypothetical protein
MLRRLTAALAMLGILALLGVLAWEVYHHRRAGMGEPAVVVKLALSARLIA